MTAVIGEPQTGRREEPAKNCVIYVCGQRGKEVDAGEKGRSEGAPVAADVCRKTKGAPQTTSSAPAEKRMRRP